MEITIFNGCHDTQPQNLKLSFEEIAQAVHDIWIKEPWKRSAKSKRKAVIFGRCEGRRSNANVKFLSCLAADIDTAPDSPLYMRFDDMCDRLEADGFAYVAHTTTTSRESHHKYRLILPYPNDVSVEFCRTAWHEVNERFGGCFDKSTHDPARLSFLPANWTETSYTNDRGDAVNITDPYTTSRYSLSGRAILSVEEIAGLRTDKMPAASKSSGRILATPPKLLPSELATLSIGRDRSWHGWHYLSDIKTSPLVTKWAKNDLPQQAGSRDYNFLKSVVRAAVRLEYPIDHPTLVRLAEQFSVQFLKRSAPDDLDAQAHNALAYVYHHNKIPSQLGGDNPSQSETGNSTL